MPKSPNARGRAVAESVRLAAQPAPLAAIQRKTVAALTLEAMRDRILRGVYAEGAALRQDAVAAELGVSRSPVREALRQLEVEGLVTFRAHIGAVVSSLALNEIEEVFELRSAMAPDLLQRALPAITPADLGRAADILDTFDLALATGNVGAWGRLNWEFHSTLMKPADRPLTMQILRHLRYQSDRYASLHISLTHAQTLAQEEHRAILRLVREGRGEEACAMLARHILSAGSELIAFLRVQRESVEGARSAKA